MESMNRFDNVILSDREITMAARSVARACKLTRRQAQGMMLHEIEDECKDIAWERFPSLQDDEMGTIAAIAEEAAEIVDGR